MKNAIYDFTEDILIVSLCGEIDHHNAASLRREIDESMTAFHAKNLILDYSDVSFMDSSGIGLAMGRYNKVKELSGSIVIVPGSPYVSRVLGLSGLFGADVLPSALFVLLSECAGEYGSCGGRG